MKIENVRTYNWQNAFRGLRNPMDSWDRSDSIYGLDSFDFDEDYEVAGLWMNKYYPNLDEDSDEYFSKEDDYIQWLCENGIIARNSVNDCGEFFFIGPNDMDLAQRMIAGKEPNDKFLRQIFVSMDITAPLLWWKEMDQYKIATTTNSTSTMHKIHSYPITKDCFEMDDYEGENLMVINEDETDFYFVEDHIREHIKFLEELRQMYLRYKDKDPAIAKKYWKELIRWNPDGWLQKRTWTADYITLRHIYHWRRNHKLTEWHTFCDKIMTLPYAKDLIAYEN